MINRYDLPNCPPLDIGGNRSLGLPQGISVEKASITKDEIGNAIPVNRTFLGKSVFVGNNTAVKLIDSTFSRTHMILNPALNTGVVSTAFPINTQTVVASGTAASSVPVFAYTQAHIYVKILSISGNWDIIAQSYNSNELLYYDVQTLLSGVTATGQYYYFLNGLGLSEFLNFRWIMNVAGTLIFSISVILKNVTYGSSIGTNIAGYIPTILYLGSQGVTTTSGYPLASGQREIFKLAEGLELWGISNQALYANIFSL